MAKPGSSNHAKGRERQLRQQEKAKKKAELRAAKKARLLAQPTQEE